MNGSRRARRERVAGLALAAALVGTLVAWMAGWTWIAAPSALAVLGLAATAAGADSRRAGDWRRAGTN